LFLWSCEDKPILNTTGVPNDDIWLIQKGRVVDAGPGWDGIPALVDPEMVNSSDVDYVGDQELVIGIKTTDGIRIYPHKILDWHEIINEQVGGHFYAINYCPLTGTAMGWNRFFDGKLLQFRVSGFLFNSNLISFDDRTLSLWSQMLAKCVNGDFIGGEVEEFPIIETTWETMMKMYPVSQVVSLNTGFNRPYDTYPYLDPLSGADYRLEPWLISPIQINDDRLHRKERVLGVVSPHGVARVYRFNTFEGDLKLIHDVFQGDKIVVAGSSNLNLMVAFHPRTLEGDAIELRELQNNLPAIMTDTEGNKWNAFGEAIEGPRQGEYLEKAKSFIGFWFAWGTFYENAEIYQ